MAEENINVNLEDKLNAIGDEIASKHHVKTETNIQVIGSDIPKKPVKKRVPPKVEQVVEMVEEDEEEEEEYEEESMDVVDDEEEEEEDQRDIDEVIAESNKENPQPSEPKVKSTIREPEPISDAFEEFEKSLDIEEEIKEEQKKTGKRNSILDSIKVDLNNIEIIDDIDPMSMSAIEDIVLNDKTTMLVTCCQSSYSAQMSALKNQEISNISDSNVDYYTYMRRLYQTIHRHIESTSVGRLDYGKWLHVTSYFDIDTLLYGIYCQTFDYENKYNITCPNRDCGKSFDAIVNNNTLIELRGNQDDTYAKIDEIINNVHEADKLLEVSHVHKTKRIILNESKIIVDIHIPSVYDYLERVVRRNNEQRLEEYRNAIGLSLFISNIYLPNVLLLKQSGTLKYIKLNISDGFEGNLVSTISNLSYYDSLQLTDEINDFIEKYRIEYSIRDITCPHCGHVIKKVPLDMQTILFSTITRATIDR